MSKIAWGRIPTGSKVDAGSGTAVRRSAVTPQYVHWPSFRSLAPSRTLAQGSGSASGKARPISEVRTSSFWAVQRRQRVRTLQWTASNRRLLCLRAHCGRCQNNLSAVSPNIAEAALATNGTRRFAGMTIPYRPQSQAPVQRHSISASGSTVPGEGSGGRPPQR